MNTRILTGAMVLFVSASALAQTNLTDQINAVGTAVAEQRNQEATEQATRDAQYQQAQAEQRRADEARERASAAARAKEQARVEQLAAARQAREAKDEAYQDQLRDLELQQKKLELQAQQTAVNRENDMIDQKLKHDAAETDLVQSKADANRNLSQGEKTLLQDSGTAKVKKASGWFN